MRKSLSIRTDAEREVAAWLCRWTVAWTDEKVAPVWASCDRTMFKQLVALWAPQVNLSSTEADTLLARFDGRYEPFLQWIRRWASHAVVGRQFRANPRAKDAKPIMAVRIEGAPFAVVLLGEDHHRRFGALASPRTPDQGALHS